MLRPYSHWQWKLLSHVWLFAIHGLYSPWNSPGQNTGVGSLSLLQGIVPPWDWNQVSRTAGGFFTSWATVQFSSVQSLSRVQLFATPWIAAHQASLSITSSQSSLKLTSIESVMPSSHLILCHPLFLLPPILPSIRVFSNESTLCMSWATREAQILEWVAYPFSSGSSRPRNRTRVSCIAGRFLINWAIREAR